jgi:uncharacterized protein DUF1206
VAKAAVYLIVGGVAARIAFGLGGRFTDTRGALATILGQPFGRGLLAVAAMGLAGYATWLLLSAALDIEGRGSGLLGWLKRLGVSLRGVVHAAIAAQAAFMVMGTGRRGGSAVREWTARGLDAPFGVWLVAIAGASVLAYGGYQFYRALAGDPAEHLDLAALGARAAAWAVRFGRFGMGARGLVVSVMGVFLLRAALRYDARQAKGLAEALRALDSRSDPPWLLAAVAVGLVSYGLYELFEARYRRIRAA